ncbi:MAG: hypothetical protein V1833_01120 [Elusimicrobiota bacterium]
MSMLEKNQGLEDLEQKLWDWNRGRCPKPEISREKLMELRDY